MAEIIGIKVTVNDKQAIEKLTKLVDLCNQLDKHTINIDVAAIGRQLNTINKKLNQLTGKPQKVSVVADAQRAIAQTEKVKAQIQSKPVRLTFAMGKIGAGMLSVANSVSKVMDNSLTNVFRNMGATVTAQFTSSIFAGIGKTVERFDTFKLYEKQMKQMGAAEEEARKSLDDLNKSVTGLPTSLNEIMDVQKQFYSMTGDVTEATKLAIATNNAFLASGSSEQQRQQGMKQIINMLSGGKLKKTQWLSLTRSMPGAIREMGKEAGLSGKKLNDFVKNVNAGQLSTKSFLNLLKDAGTEGSLVKIAEVSKQSLSGFQANLQTAVASFGTNVLQAIDDVLDKSTGEGLVQHLYHISKAIKELGDKAANWIRSHPEEITEWLDRLHNFDWEGLGKGMMSAAKLFSNFIALLSKLPAGPLGFIIAGGGAAIMKGLYPIAGIMKSIGQMGDIQDAARKAKGMGEAVSEAGEAVGGKGMKQGMGKLAKGVGNISKATKLMGQMALGGGVALEFVGVAVLAAKAFKYIAGLHIPLKDLMGNIGKISLAIGALTGVFTALGFLMTSTPIGWAATVDALVGGGVSSAVVKMFEGIAKMLNAINKVKVPSSEKIRRIISATKKVFEDMSGITGSALTDFLLPGSAFGRVLSAWADSKVVEFYVKGFANVGKLLSSMGDIKVSKAVDTGGITNAIKSVADVITNITTDHFLIEDIVKNWKTSNMAKTFKSLGTIVEGVNSLFEGAKGIAKFDVKKLDVKGISDKIAKVLEVAGEIGNTLRESAPQYFNGVLGQAGYETEVDNKELSGFAQKIQSITTIISNIAGMTGTFKTLEDAYQKMKQDFGSKKNPASWKEISETMKARLNGIADFIEDVFGNTAGASGRLKGATNNLEKVDLASINKAIRGLKGTVFSLSGLQEAINSNKSMFKVGKNGESGLDGLTGTMKRITEGLQTISDSIKDPDEIREKMYAVRKAVASLVFAMGNVQKLSQFDVDIGGVFSKLKAVVNHMVNIGAKITDPEDFRNKMYAVRMAMASLALAMGSVKKLPGLIEGIDGAAIADSIKNIINKLAGALTQAPDMLVNAGDFRYAASDVQKALGFLTGGDNGSIEVFVSYLGKIPGAISKVNSAMNGRGTAWKNSLVNGFKGTAEQILSVVRNLPAKLKQISGFYNAGLTHGGQYKDGFEFALNGINTQIQQTQNTIEHTRTLANALDNANQVASIFSHTGGYIGNNGVQYRADGGELFKPRGVDTVPAMLQPGEYVQRKKAVDTYGVRFMQKINNLDLGGALNSLSTRIGSKLLGGTTVHNYNNQKVVQHIHTNNENWSFMRANRFVRGLS